MFTSPLSLLASFLSHSVDPPARRRPTTFPPSCLLKLSPWAYATWELPFFSHLNKRLLSRNESATCRWIEFEYNVRRLHQNPRKYLRNIIFGRDFRCHPPIVSNLKQSSFILSSTSNPQLQSVWFIVGPEVGSSWSPPPFRLIQDVTRGCWMGQLALGIQILSAGFSLPNLWQDGADFCFENRPILCTSAILSQPGVRAMLKGDVLCAIRDKIDWTCVFFHPSIFAPAMLIWPYFAFTSPSHQGIWRCHIYYSKKAYRASSLNKQRTSYSDRIEYDGVFGNSGHSFNRKSKKVQTLNKYQNVQTTNQPLRSCARYLHTSRLIHTTPIFPDYCRSWYKWRGKELVYCSSRKLAWPICLTPSATMIC